MKRHSFPRDAVVFKPQVPARSISVQMGLDHFHRRIVTDVAVKLAVKRMARISDHIGPNLPARFYVARENRDAVLANHRRVYTETLTRISVKERVRISDKIFDAGRLKRGDRVLLLVASAGITTGYATLTF